MAMTYRAALTAILAGDRIMVTHARPDRPSDNTTYGLVNSGKNVGSRTFDKLKSEGMIEECKDGLFPDEPSQTWKWSGQ